MNHEHELVALLREELPSPAQREAMDRRLAALGISVAAGAALAATGTASAMGAATATSSMGAGWVAKLATLGVGKVVVGAVAVGAVTASLAWPRAPVAQPVERAERVQTAPVARASEPRVVEPPLPEKPPRAKKLPTRRKVDAAASTLDAESSLLGAAVEALHAGRTDEARTLLAQHARRYPNGILRAERQRAQAQLRALAVP